MAPQNSGGETGYHTTLYVASDIPTCLPAHKHTQQPGLTDALHCFVLSTALMHNRHIFQHPSLSEGPSKAVVIGGASGNPRLYCEKLFADYSVFSAAKYLAFIANQQQRVRPCRAVWAHEGGRTHDGCTARRHKKSLARLEGHAWGHGIRKRAKRPW